jgi:hypothetical protein
MNMTIVEELEQAQGELIAVKTERDEVTAKLTAADVAAVGATAKMAELEAEKVKASEALAQIQDEMVKAVSERDVQISQLTAELADAKAKLANPAFVLAAGDGKSIGEGGQASDKMTREQALAEYNKIEDPVEAAKFRAEHREELGLK